MTSKFVTIMEAIGRDIKAAWADVVKYLPMASTIASLIFPAQAATISGVVNSIDLIQQAVATVEQKFAAAGIASGTGAQKLAQVISLVSPTVTELLTQEGLNYNETQITGIVNAVVAILNVQTTTAAPAPAAAAPTAS
jgi:hypothetical protein